MSFEHNFTTTGNVNGPALSAVLAVETVIAFIANTVVLSITLYQRKSWKQSSTIFFTSLILSHLVMVFLYLPLCVIAVAAEEWIFGSTFNQKIATCSFAAYVIWYCVLVIQMTLAIISFDRFLFIVKPHFHKRLMKPWTALAFTIAIWILAAILNSGPFVGLGEYEYDDTYGSCVPLWQGNEGYILFMLIISMISITIIVVTSIWTFCFTRKFINDQSQVSGDSVYVSRKKRLFGIFGSMLLVYGICFLPSIVSGGITTVVILPDPVYAVNLVTFQFITVASPLVQSYFRPDIKAAIISFFALFAPALKKWQELTSRSHDTSTSVPA